MSPVITNALHRCSYKNVLISKFHENSVQNMEWCLQWKFLMIFCSVLLQGSPSCQISASATVHWAHFILIRMWHESGCSCCWWSQWHCQKLSLIAFFLSLDLWCLFKLLLQLSKAANTFPFCFPKFLHADTSVVPLQWQLDTYSICLFFSSFRDQVLHPQRCYASYIARRN
jgi:hypothetical protein